VLEREAHSPAALKLPPGRAESFADTGSLSWINAILGWIWPKANTALTRYVHADLTPRLREALPSPFKDMHFSRFTLGQNTPEFGPIEVIRHSDTHIEVDLQIRFLSDVDILLDAGAGGITLGIRRVTFVGRLCIVLRPVMEKLPLVGAVKVFFAALPQVGLKFTGLAAVAHLAGIEQMVQRTVDEWMRSRLVLPARKVFLLASDEEDLDLVEAFGHVPLGVLRVRVLRGRHLAGVNWSALDVEHFTSDPYCELRVGAHSTRTSTVVGSTSPEWPTEEPNAYFVVYHREQHLEVDVLGEDNGLFARNFTGFLGKSSVSVWRIMEEWDLGASSLSARRSRLTLDTNQVTRDMLHVNDPVNRGIASELELEAEWFDLFEAQPRRALPGSDNSGAPMALLIVEIYKGTGFPLDASSQGHGLRWRSHVEIDDAPVVSRRGDTCDVEEVEFPEVPINPRLFSVIDKLVDRKFSIEDIAQITGVESPELITLYLQSKEEYEVNAERLLETQMHEDHRVSLQWYDAMSHFIRRPETAVLTLGLLDGQDREVGRLGPLPVAPLLQGQGLDPERSKHSLICPVPADDGSKNSGGLISWLMQPREPLPVPGARRFATVELELSVQLRFLQVGQVGG